MKCKECGKEYNGINGLSVHIAKAHNVTKAEYATKHTEVKPKCECGCGQETTFESLSAGFKDYVRGHHPGWNAGETKETNEKLRKVGEKISEVRSKQDLGRRTEWVEYGCKNPECPETIECPPSQEGHKRYCSESCREQHIDIKRKERRNDTVTCACERCGEEFENQRNPCGKLQKRKYCEECVNKARAEATAEFNKELPSRTPETEKAVMDWLDDKGFEYEHQVAISGYVVDFLLPNHDRVVECYGDYWHCNPSQFSADDENPTTGEFAKDVWEKDAAREQEICDEGYRVTVLWESEIGNAR